MIGLQRSWTMLLVSALFIAGGCTQKQEVPAAAKTPEVTLSCIGVMPVASSTDYDTGESNSDPKSLRDGVKVLDRLLQAKFLGRKDVRFMGKAQLYGMELTGTEDFFARARKVGNTLSCNGVLELTLWRYKNRVGGQYTAEEPASVSFTYRLVEVNSGTILCQGRYDEVQKSVMENLYDFSSARQRGFTWVTAEELLREGLGNKLGECSYLQNGE